MPFSVGFPDRLSSVACNDTFRLPEVSVRGVDVHVVSWSTLPSELDLMWTLFIWVSFLPKNVICDHCECFTIRSMSSSHSLSMGKSDHPIDRQTWCLERASSRYTLIDPNADEERLMNGFLSISMNENKEICGIQMGGNLGLKREQVSRRSFRGTSETVGPSSRLISARNLLSAKC